VAQSQRTEEEVELLLHHAHGALGRGDRLRGLLQVLARLFIGSTSFPQRLFGLTYTDIVRPTPPPLPAIGTPHKGVFFAPMCPSPGDTSRNLSHRQRCSVIFPPLRPITPVAPAVAVGFHSVCRADRGGIA
jgi:hypothetical protein